MARAGSVASALRPIAKHIMTGGEHVARILATSDKGPEILQGQVASEEGVGHAILERFLEGIPGINETTVKQALANLESGTNPAGAHRAWHADRERGSVEHDPWRRLRPERL